MKTHQRQSPRVTPSPNPQLTKMRRIATGLLVMMIVLYVLARSLEGQGAFWPWLRAFSEAATVGALADWFAVTALFRHPLGIPIPHTAIVRNEKDRIGRAVAGFVRKSFLTPEEVARQWARWSPFSRLVTKLAQPAESERALRWTLDRFPALLGKGDRETMANLGAAGLRRAVRNIPMARLVTIFLQGFLKSPGRRSLIAPILGRLGKSVADNRDWVMDEASKSTSPRRIKLFNALSKAAASAVSGKAVEKFSAELTTASRDETHGLYDKIEEALAETAHELDGGSGEQWEALKSRILDDPETQETLEEVMQKASAILVESAESLRDGDAITDWSRILSNAAARLAENGDQLARWEARTGELTSRFFLRHGPGFEKIISQTVESWEAEELIDRLESQVGSDLQFIRINGTLIGGLVGLLLYGVGLLIWS
ncbi:DUF445 domain-containing protein [Verrucomicrobiaceae bacterium 227]